jgi:hypothetical protein
MLEEIHGTPEDRRTTQAIVAAGVLGSGLFTMADAILSQWNGIGVGALLAASGVAMLAWLRTRDLHGPQEA